MTLKSDTDKRKKVNRYLGQTFQIVLIDIQLQF